MDDVKKTDSNVDPFIYGTMISIVAQLPGKDKNLTSVDCLMVQIYDDSLGRHQQAYWPIFAFGSRTTQTVKRQTKFGG